MIASVLQTKLEALDAECEAAARPSVDKLYVEARYDGSRFCVPSFQAAGKIWLDVIAEKERHFIWEIGRVMGTPGAILSQAGGAKIQGVVEATFSDFKYLERLVRFSEGVAQRAAAYGIRLDLVAYRLDIADSAYRAGVTSAVRKARANVLAELALHSQSSVPDSVRLWRTWWLYFCAHPWKTLGVLALLGLVWLISSPIPAYVLSWIRAR